MEVSVDLKTIINKIQAAFDRIQKLEEENKKLITVLKMVENNSLMPHQHDDYYTRLCCLSERASEVLKGS
jgi:ribosomal protein S19E (S16A)